MDDRMREKHEKVLADYKRLVEGWPLKPNIEERIAAFKEAQEVLRRVRQAEECLAEPMSDHMKQQFKKDLVVKTSSHQPLIC